MTFERAFAACRHLTQLCETKCLGLWSAATTLGDVPGALAELGVYRGGSAKLLSLACPQRRLHLFDTFTGIPWDDYAAEVDGHHPGEFAEGLDQVRDYLAECSGVVFHPGLFPRSASGLTNERFALVHLDADLYASTRAGLEWFWPRLSTGGAIVLDDYEWPWCPGVKKAVDEFFADKSNVSFRCIPHQLTVIKS